MQIALANPTHIPEIVPFFNANLDRDQGLLKKMLETINDYPIISLCLTDSNLNFYYNKSGGCLQDQNERFNVWIFNNSPRIE